MEQNFHFNKSSSGIVSRDLYHVIYFRLYFPNIVVLNNVSLKDCFVITDENQYIIWSISRTEKDSKSIIEYLSQRRQDGGSN